MEPRLQLKPKYFPVQAFFNAISDSYFVQAIHYLSEGVGIGYEVTHCNFSNDREPDEPPFEGAHFHVFEDEVFVTWSELRDFVKLACDSYVKNHPGDRLTLDSLLGRFPTNNAELESRER